MEMILFPKSCLAGQTTFILFLTYHVWKWDKSRIDDSCLQISLVLMSMQETSSVPTFFKIKFWMSPSFFSWESLNMELVMALRNRECSKDYKLKLIQKHNRSYIYKGNIKGLTSSMYLYKLKHCYTTSDQSWAYTCKK